VGAGAHQPRHHGGDGHRAAAEFGPQSLGEADGGGLGGAVRQQVRDADLAADRGVLAAAVHARGLWQSDAGALHEAAGLLAGGEQPLATAAAQEDLASALARRGEKDDAVAVLEAAYGTYHSANAGRDLARVRGALHALGVRKRQPSVARPRRGWAGLTSGELAVVRSSPRA